MEEVGSHLWGEGGGHLGSQTPATSDSSAPLGARPLPGTRFTVFSPSMQCSMQQCILGSLGWVLKKAGTTCSDQTQAPLPPPKSLLGYWWGKPRIHPFHKHWAGNSLQLPPMPRPGGLAQSHLSGHGFKGIRLPRRESARSISPHPTAEPSEEPASRVTGVGSQRELLLQNRERQVQCLSSRLWVQCFRRVVAAPTPCTNHPATNQLQARRRRGDHQLAALQSHLPTLSSKAAWPAGGTQVGGFPAVSSQGSGERGSLGLEIRLALRTDLPSRELVKNRGGLVQDRD
ncbi:membrane protein [Platysternon megacephalum]|uniref:Membrane protein n=1 Tax=Platysternon megacephalum TaxID=55544 RepID=A0A4D9DGF6_9SAUR|nr:membrane protein [Platysternon megacephalum]